MAPAPVRCGRWSGVPVPACRACCAGVHPGCALHGHRGGRAVVLSLWKRPGAC